jgi:DNA-binding NtrC family response regulator
LMSKLAVEAAGRPITEASLRAQLRTASRETSGELQNWEDLPFHEAIARCERHLIERALRLAGGNKSNAARRLGIQRRLLYEKMQQFASKE